MIFHEETTRNWTRGDLNGVWTPSFGDVNALYRLQPANKSWLNNTSCDELLTEYFYNAREMTLPMLSDKSLQYSLTHRRKLFNKMKCMPWDDAIISAFHNLQFAFYMADIPPAFTVPVHIKELPHEDCFDCQPWVMGDRLFILKMLYEEASNVLGKEFVSNTDEECRIGTLLIDDDGAVGISIHVVGCCVFDLWVDFLPRFFHRYTFTTRVELEAHTFDDEPLPLRGRHSPGTNYLPLVKKLKEKVELNMGTLYKKLIDAPFNQEQFRPDDMK